MFKLFHYWKRVHPPVLSQMKDPLLISFPDTLFSGIPLCKLVPPSVTAVSPATRTFFANFVKMPFSRINESLVHDVLIGINKNWQLELKIFVRCSECTLTCNSWLIRWVVRRTNPGCRMRGSCPLSVSWIVSKEEILFDILCDWKVLSLLFLARTLNMPGWARTTRRRAPTRPQWCRARRAARALAWAGGGWRGSGLAWWPPASARSRPGSGSPRSCW